MLPPIVLEEYNELGANGENGCTLGEPVGVIVNALGLLSTKRLLCAVSNFVELALEIAAILVPELCVVARAPVGGVNAPV
jgi:hypothetical protein